MSRLFPLAIAFVLSASAVAQAQSLRRLQTFDPASEGTSTAGTLMQANDGLFYGVNRSDGPHGQGTLFRMTPNGTLLVLHAFTGADDGGRPAGPLLQRLDGHLYGTTSSGGLHNRGIAFRITLDGTLTVLHDFGETDDAARSPGALMQTADGRLFGTSCTGGGSNAGSIFRMTAAGEVTPLYAFTDGAEGRCPSSVLMARDGMLYGVAAGGPTGEGVAFRMTAEGDFLKIHDYVRNIEGGAPGPLLQSAFDGMFYGTTSTIGGFFNFSSGSVYRMTPAGAVQVLHKFGDPNGGSDAVGRLVEGGDGNFYGVTRYGGLPYSYYTSMGTVFRVTRDGKYTLMRYFRGFFDGMNPESGLMQGGDGHLYGYVTGGFDGPGIYRIETYLCTSTVEATYFPASQTLSLTVFVQSAGPGTWSMWAISSAGLTPLWSGPVPPVSLPFGISFSYNVVPAGPILFLSRLDVPGFGSCGGLSLVDTGFPTSPSSP